METPAKQTATQESALTVAPNKQQERAPIPFGERGIEIRDLDSLWRFSSYVAKSGLAPKGIETNEAIFTAIQMGLEVGLTPMAALQNIAVINGRPTIWGDAQLGIVRATGLLLRCVEMETNDKILPLFIAFCLEDDTESKKKMMVEIATHQATAKKDADDWGASCFVHRKGCDPSFSRFTVGEARKAGLWGGNVWGKYPSRMLKFRARSHGLRDNFGDALKGLRTPEEASDIDEVRFENAKPVKTPNFGGAPVIEQPTREEQPATETATVTPESKSEPKKEPAKAPKTPTPHQELAALLDANAITFLMLRNWGQFPDADSFSEIGELPLKTVNLLLANRAWILEITGGPAK